MPPTMLDRWKRDLAEALEALDELRGKPVELENVEAVAAWEGRAAEARLKIEEEEERGLFRLGSLPARGELRAKTMCAALVDCGRCWQQCHRD